MSTISKQVYLSDLGAGLTYPLDTYAPFGYTVTEVYGIQTSSGTVTAALQINATDITGLGSISVSSTPQNVAATADNVVSVGDALTLVFSSNSSAENIQFTLAATESDDVTPGGSDGQVQYNDDGAFGGLATGQLPGTATNDNASAGNIGEYVSSTVASGSAVSLTNNTATNITSISLTAGDWDVWGIATFGGSATTNVSVLQAEISTTSAGISGNPGQYASEFFDNETVFDYLADATLSAGPLRFSLASTTTIYFAADAIFETSTCKVWGILQARRVR